MDDTQPPDALGDLLRHLGPGWERSGAEQAWRAEPGLNVGVALKIDEEGRATVRVEVRPVVGWAWYVGPILAPLLAVQLGMDTVRALLLGVLFLGVARVVVGRLVLRPRVVARRTRLQNEIAEAMAQLGGTAAGA